MTADQMTGAERLRMLNMPTVNGSNPGGGEADEPEDAPQVAPPLAFHSIADMAHSVRNAPRPEWLVRRIWPADAYGILGAEDKAGKTWAILDMAIAVAAGTRWLDHWDVDRTGAVLVFLGEGSERKMMRRLYAIGSHYGLAEEAVDALPIRLCMKVPTLTNAQHLAAVMAELAAHPARLVVLDPLYLAAGETESSQLNKMGVVLGAIQHAAQAAGAALIVAHHWNKSGEGTDRKRFTGAGTAEWGRVLASMSIIRRRTDDDGRSIVDLKLEVIGDEIADNEVTFRRTVWTDDPDDLGADMHYRVERTELDPSERGDGGYDAAKSAAEGLRHFFATHPTEELSTRALYQRLRECGLNHDDKSVRNGAGDLVAEGYLTVRDGPRKARIYSLTHRTQGDEP